MNTYTKLKNGTWGVRVSGAARAGQTVTVKTKAGETKVETIAAVIWAGNGVSLCAIKSAGGRSSSSNGGCCDECGQRASRLVSCHDSSGLSGRCCPACARMSDYERSFA